MNRNRLRDLWQKRSADLAALLAILVFFLILFKSAIFGGEFFINGDPLTYTYPLRMVAWDAIRHGSLPLWTPLILSGYPLLSMAQLGIGYPITWVYFFIHGPWAEQVYILAPYLLAPAFTYAYAREIGRSRLSSLLAGLGFGYAGLTFSSLGLNGMLPNAVMWLPLMLIAIERARTRPFIPYLLLATGAYAMSILTGIGQGFVYAGYLAAAYAAFTVAFPTVINNEEHADPPGWKTWRRWRPLAVIVGGIVLAAGVAAFQIAETLRAAKLSVRGKLSYEQFSDGSFPFSIAWRNLLQPIHPYGDVTTYVAPLVIVFAILAVAFAIRDRRRDLRIFFWLAVAVIAWILILGKYSPIFHAVYQIPFINRFRIPSRHSFEWTFALSILAAYGYDAMSSLITIRKRSFSMRRESVRIALVIISLLLGLTAGRWWWSKSGDSHLDKTSAPEILDYTYVGWKAIFYLLMAFAIWQCWRVTSNKWRTALLGCSIVIACFVEPFIELSRWHPYLIVPISCLTTFAPTTSLLQQYPPQQNRVYTQMRPDWDSTNYTALAGLHNVAGYEPLIIERYSRALNSSHWSVVNRDPSPVPDPTLLEASCHVLDLLNTTYFVDRANTINLPEEWVEKDGITFYSSNLSTDVKPHEAVRLNGAGKEGDTLAIVTTLGNSGDLADGTVVGKISVHTSDGRLIEREIRAGIDTAEWAHDRVDVRSNIRHGLAPIFETYPGDNENSFPAYRFWSRINLGERVRIDRIEIIKMVKTAGLGLWKASLHDSVSRHSTPLMLCLPDKWQQVYQENGMIVLRNLRALPRAWLVTEAESVNNFEAWERIRGKSSRPFDPRRTALLELDPQKMPALGGRPLSPDSYARINNYEPNRLTIETNSDQQAVLVLSEINYPGWVATIDGTKTPVHATNFILRGIIVPPGKHRIEMNYRAPEAFKGAVISLFTLILIGGLAVYAKRSSAK